MTLEQWAEMYGCHVTHESYVGYEPGDFVTVDLSGQGNIGTAQHDLVRLEDYELSDSNGCLIYSLHRPGIVKPPLFDFEKAWPGHPDA